MGNDNIKYNVIEDNGGNLLLTTFDDSCTPVAGCYPRPEDLGTCIKDLIKDRGDMSGWENTEKDAKAEYSSVISQHCGWEFVADESGFIRPERWGRAATEAFADIDHRGETMVQIK
jgi:hypothetical protein